MEIDAMDEDALLQTPALSVDQPAVTPAPLAGGRGGTSNLGEELGCQRGCCTGARLSSPLTHGQ